MPRVAQTRLALAVAGLCALPAFAANKLEEVTVISSRVEMPLRQVATSVSVVTAEPAAPAVKPCTATTFTFPQVENACKKGGQKAAQDLMKSVVKKAKAAGQDLNCKSCHVSTKTFELKPNAVDDLRPLL